MPAVLQPRHTDEFLPPAPKRIERDAIERVRAAGACAGRRGTAQGLRALNAAAGADYYDVPAEAEAENDAADEAFASRELVIDVQTHFVADRTLPRWNAMLQPMYRELMPDWWAGMDNLVDYSMAEYLRCVFLESETALAVLTSAAGASDRRMLRNPELAGVHELVDRLGAGGRLLNHTVVEPQHPGQLDAMTYAHEHFQPVGWKVYTLGSPASGDPGWYLDDGAIGLPFLQQAQDLGVRLVCAHKGMSALVDTGSPRDVGPAARVFPDLDFVIYHSGYESNGPPEGPYTEATADLGVNRLITSLRHAGIGPGANVYAELGTTWFCLIRSPVEAAHVLGKLLLAVGEDNVIWGSDGIWYGPAQPAIDAFRAFRIPDELCERFGYPQLTAERKTKILETNAARVYSIDTDALRARVATDELTWVRAALDEYRRAGVPEATT
jgi:predicted TIM-barrel fold metal-dependent hydrolase